MKKIKSLLTNVKTENLAVILAFCVILGMVYSPFLLSVSMIGLGVIAIFSCKNGRLIINPKLRENTKSYLYSKVYLVISISFFLVLISGLYLDEGNFSYWLERIRLKVTFLLFPFVFYSIPTFSKRSFFIIFYFLVVVIFFTGIAITSYYVLNFEETNVLLLQGQPMPTPRNHIRLSLLVAYSIFAGFYLFKQKFYLKYRWESKLLLVISGFLLLFIHLLSVRSGIAAFYITAFILILRYAWINKKIFSGFLVIGLLTSLFFLSYLTIPSFKAKVAYSLYEQKIRQNNQNSLEYSDGARLMSIKIGLEIGNEHPVFGVGAGNLKQKVKTRYLKYPQIEDVKMPHNQFVTIYAGSGLVGLIFFLFALIYPLIFQNAYKSFLFLSFSIIVFLSFIVENTIENSIGIAFYLFFLLLNLNYQKKSVISKCL